MPQTVSETASRLDPDHSALTQALLETSFTHEEDETEVPHPYGGKITPDHVSYTHKLVHSFPGHAVPVIASFGQHEGTEMQAVKSVKEFTMKTLGWLTCPVTTGEEDAALPTISVYSDPELTEELELVVHSNGEGTAQVVGQRLAGLKSQGSHKPSVASFEGIRIKRAGLYVFEVRSVRVPDLSLVADLPITIVPHVSTHSSITDANLPEECGLGKVQMWGV